jgi:hypothetical protein
MQVDFDKLRESIRINLNDLCTIANDSKFRYDEEFLLIDPEGLQIAIEDLRNDIAILLSIINPESGKFIEGDIEAFDLASIEVEP